MSLASSIGGLIGFMTGGAGGAALGSIAGGLLSGDIKNLGDALSTGIGSLFTGGTMGKTGFAMDVLSAMGGGDNQASGRNLLSMMTGGANAPAAGGGAQQARPGMAGAQQGIANLLSATGMNNPLGMAMLLQAFEPKGSLMTPLQQRQMETGERLPDYAGTAAPDYRYMPNVQMRAQGGFIEGPGTGTRDSIPSMIYQDGGPVQEARLSDGEFVMTADAVRGAGGGNRNKGAARMYELMRQYERMA